MFVPMDWEVSGELVGGQYGKSMYFVASNVVGKPGKAG